MARSVSLLGDHVRVTCWSPEIVVRPVGAAGGGLDG